MRRRRKIELYDDPVVRQAFQRRQAILTAHWSWFQEHVFLVRRTVALMTLPVWSEPLAKGRRPAKRQRRLDDYWERRFPLKNSQ